MTSVRIFTILVWASILMGCDLVAPLVGGYEFEGLGRPTDCTDPRMVIGVSGDFCELAIEWATYNLHQVEPDAVVVRAFVFDPPLGQYLASMNFVVLELEDGRRDVRRLITCPGSVCEGVAPPAS